jgi:hypothetical protein
MVVSSWDASVVLIAIDDIGVISGETVRLMPVLQPLHLRRERGNKIWFYSLEWGKVGSESEDAVIRE